MKIQPLFGLLASALLMSCIPVSAKWKYSFNVSPYCYAGGDKNETPRVCFLPDDDSLKRLTDMDVNGISAPPEFAGGDHPFVLFPLDDNAHPGLAVEAARYFLEFDLSGQRAGRPDECTRLFLRPRAEPATIKDTITYCAIQGPVKFPQELWS